MYNYVVVQAHLWDGNYVRQKKGNGGRTRGRQVYLGGWASEEAAGTAYDLAALWFWGEDARLNVRVLPSTYAGLVLLCERDSASRWQQIYSCNNSCAML